MSAAQIISPDQLQNEIALLNKKLTESDEKIFCLEEQLAWFKRQLFGKKSEKTVSDLNGNQLFLAGFDGVSLQLHKRQKKTFPPTLVVSPIVTAKIKSNFPQISPL